MRLGLLPPAAIAGLLVLAGCGRPVVEGEVRNVRGEQLPGVVVSVLGTEFQDLSDARGAFRVRYASGRRRVRFSKTGYSSREIRLGDAGGRVHVDPVTLWQLPSSAGVFLFEDYQYESTTRVFPERFFMAEGHVDHGTQRETAAHTASSRPVIVCFNTPRYGTLLSRLRREEAKIATKNSSAFQVWVAAGTEKVDLVPIDNPDGLLLRLQLVQPLEPGVYAVHWGALDGYLTLERRMFMFEVLTPRMPVEAPPVDPPANALSTPTKPIPDAANEKAKAGEIATPETFVAPPPAPPRRPPAFPPLPELFPEDTPELDPVEPPRENEANPRPFEDTDTPPRGLASASFAWGMENRYLTSSFSGA